LLRVARAVKLIFPLAGKDVRAWRQAGCTADMLRTRIRNAYDFGKKTIAHNRK